MIWLLIPFQPQLKTPFPLLTVLQPCSQSLFLLNMTSGLPLTPGLRAFACDANSACTAPPSDHHRADFLSFRSQLAGYRLRKAFHDNPD